MDEARVVEVWVPVLNRVGSGYLLSERLVLTSFHVVRGLHADAPIEVRPLQVPQRTPWLHASLVWPPGPVDLAVMPEQDAALLVIDAPGVQGLRGKVRFGKISGPDPVECQGLGFPRAEARPPDRRDTMPVRGHVDPLQGRKSQMLTVHIDRGIVPRRRNGGSGWSGSSGTALFCGPLLVGVLATDRDIADDARALGAAALSTVAQLPGFRNTLAEHGVDLRIEAAPVPATERFLARYLLAALDAARSHPYPVILPEGRTPPTLGAVYLRQDLHGPTGQDPSAAAAQVLTADDVLTQQGPGIVVADAGGGKSSLLRMWTADLISQLDAGPTGQVPVLVQAAKLIPDPAKMPALSEALAEAASSELSAYGLDPGPPAAFFRTPPMHQARWLVLVDGLDEIQAAAGRERLMKMLSRAHGDGYRVIVATRPAPDQELAPLGKDVPRYIVQPFRPGDLRTVARSWFTEVLPDRDPDAACEDFLGRLEAQGLTQLAQVPLMASMLCQVYAANPALDLPGSRIALYTRFDAMLAEHHNDHGPGSLRAQITTEMGRYADQNVLTAAQHVLNELPTLLSYLAAQRHTGNTASAPEIVAGHQDATLPRNFDPDQWHAFLANVLRRSGQLTIRAGELAFVHQTLQEYFAARHTADTGSVRDLEKLFHRPRRSGLRNHAVGRRNIPGSRYWNPPNESPSYIGFLLDAYPDGVRTQLIRLAKRGGLDGCEFIAELARLTAPLPDEAVRVATDLLSALARDPMLEGSDWYRAAEALAALDSSRAADLWHDLARDTLLGGFRRSQASEALAQLSDSRTADLWHTLALDTTLDGHGRFRAAELLAQLSDPRAAEPWRVLAHDSTVDRWLRVLAGVALSGDDASRAADVWCAAALDSALGSSDRRQAAEALAQLGDSRTADVWHTLVVTTALDGHDRLRAARALARLGDSRTADLWHTLALDTTVDGTDRFRAAEVLDKLRDPRTADVWHTLALDAELDGPDRFRAVEVLARLGDSRTTDLWHTLALDAGLEGWARVEAAEAVVEADGSRAADVWHSLALDQSFPPFARRRAAEVLAEISAPRGADVLCTIAHDKNLERFHRLGAAHALARIDATRVADVWHSLALDPTLDGFDRGQAAEALAQLGDARTVDLLHTLAQDPTLARFARRQASKMLTRLRDSHPVNTRA